MSIFDLFSLAQKRAVVSGGSGGLGAPITEALAEAGAQVVVLDVSDSVEIVAANFRDRGLSVTAQRCDLSQRQELRRGFTRALDQLDGGIDVLVNCAGIQRRHDSETFLEEDWDAVIAVNLEATFFLSQLAAKEMIKVGAGKIINVASIMSFLGGVTIPAYAASKGGVAQLTKAFSNDWAPKGICVNAIAPGYMDTPLNTALLADAGRHAEISNRIPVGRWGVAHDVKGITVFLASAASDYVTGSVIPVDGGYLAR